MENTKKNYSMKSKLISAIAMLLVATIMLVSSTYAWFTLSTKPEVSGISTAVGANGALEMLLATKDADGQWVFGTGEVGNLGPAERNKHWGNLVDLSLEEYGAGEIVLYPSILNLTDTGALNTGAPIRTPEYGADGRVEQTTPGGMFATYNTGKSGFLDDGYGFRAMGIASGLTPRQQAFRVALSQIIVNSAAAQAKARTSLSANGNTLAGIAIKKAMTDGATYNAGEIAAVGSMITGLEEALATVEAAYLEFIYATVYSSESNLEDNVATLAVNAAKAAADGVTNGALGDKIAAAITALTTNSASFTTSQLPNYTVFEGAVEAFTEAQTKYAVISSKNECTWAELSAALYPLVDMDEIKINGYTPSEVKANTNKIANDVIAGKGINVIIPTGGGVYADIADYTGDYTVGIQINTADLDLGVDVGEVDATMKADSTHTKGLLIAAKEVVATKQPTGGNAEKPITEFYGYAIDLAFKTNASTSNLLLQTTPADRIYGDNQHEETMGEGSTMTFATTDNTFSMDKMLGLMSRIKVVFYDTKTDKILANAKLDTQANKVTGSPMDGIKANLHIVDENGAIVTDPKNAVITELGPNIAQHVTVVLYLDGEGISNQDVSAIADDARSMTGTFNIQFASSADLVPMEYSDLHTVTPAANNP